MHILVASRYVPWPLNEGGKAAQFRTFEALKGTCTFTLVVPVYNEEEEAAAGCFSQKFAHVQVEAVRCYQIQQPLIFRVRLRKWLGKILRALVPPWAGKKNGFSEQAPPSSSLHYPFSLLNPEFIAVVEKHLCKEYDLFQAEFADMLTLGPSIKGRLPSLFIHYQPHFVYAQRYLKASNKSSPYERYLTKRMRGEEAAYLQSFDSVIVLSEVDRQCLGDLSSELNIYVCPFPTPEEPLEKAVEFEEPCRHFVFVASQNHHPNVDGFRWFMTEVFPSILERFPDVIIEVIGEWTESGKQSIPHHSRIKFSGFVPVLSEALRQKIMIVPLQVGSGIRTKILAAWGASCPVITTSVGGEGLPGNPGEYFIVADDSNSFANACIELASDVKKLNNLASNGLKIVKDEFSLESIRSQRLHIYQRTIQLYKKME